MKFTICFYSDFDYQSLDSFLSSRDKDKYFLKMENTKSLDEYKAIYKNKLLAICYKIIEVLKYTFKLRNSTIILFSTPHPSFRLLKFFRPNAILILYLRNIHFFSDDQSFSDRLSRKRYNNYFSVLINNYYADKYFVSGIVNKNYLIKRGLLDKNINLVGLHPLKSKIHINKTPNRIIVISQAWAAHGFTDEYTEEVKAVKSIVSYLSKLFKSKCEILLKPHPREQVDVYKDIECDIIYNYSQGSNSDIIIGGLSSFFFENANKDFYPVFFVHSFSFKYYSEILEVYNIPYCNSIYQLEFKINAILEKNDFLVREIEFINSNISPLKYYYEF